MCKLTSVGDPDVDHIHEQLIALMDVILAKLKQGLNVRFDLETMYTLAKNHFKDEEELMQEVDYPFSRTHIQSHTDTLSKIDTILSFPKDRLKDLWPILARLQDEIIGHVEHYDVALFQYSILYAALQGQGASSSLPS